MTIAAKTVTKPRVLSAQIDHQGVHSNVSTGDPLLLRSAPAPLHLTPAKTPLLARPRTQAAMMYAKDGATPPLSAATLHDWIHSGEGSATALRFALQELADSQHSEALRPKLLHTLQMMLALANRCKKDGDVHRAQALALEVVLRCGWLTQTLANKRVLGDSLYFLGHLPLNTTLYSKGPTATASWYGAERVYAFDSPFAQDENLAALSQFVGARITFEKAQGTRLCATALKDAREPPMHIEATQAMTRGLTQVTSFLQASYNELMLAAGFTPKPGTSLVEILRAAQIYLAQTQGEDKAKQLQDQIGHHAFALWQQAHCANRANDLEGAHAACKEAYLMACLAQHVELEAACLHELTLLHTVA
jgi:hypothetical protein